MSAPDRRAMLDRGDAELSVRRQCALLSVARSGVYRAAKPANDNDAALMRRIDALFTAWPFLKLSADDGDASGRGRQREPQTGAASDAPDGDRRARTEAEDEQTRARP